MPRAASRPHLAFSHPCRCLHFFQDVLEALAAQWARLKIENSALKERIQQNQQQEHRQQPSQPPPPPPPPPQPSRSASVIVVVASEDDESEDEEAERAHAEAEAEAEAALGIWDEDDAAVEDEDDAVVYRSLAPPPDPDAYAATAATGMELNMGKRPRSFTLELAAQPLHPSKQPSEASARTSPTFTQTRIAELRANIQDEMRTHEMLLAQIAADGRTLAKLQADNAKLMDELAELRRRRSAARAAR